jgi:GMP synthase (glutamine-hydrolysing)
VNTCLALRHVAFEDLGSFAAVLAERGVAVAYTEAPTADLDALDPLAPDLLVVLGGPIGAYEEDAYPFLLAELRLLEKRLAAARPVLGICLGSQILARALGARVYPGSGKEIGWAPIELSEAGRASPLRHLAAEATQVLHWHGDTFDLPAGAVRLASTPRYENQAFAVGAGVLAVQFHPEVRGRDLESWFVGHAGEIAATPGLSVTGLRAETARRAPVLEPRGRACFAEWLDGLG